MAIPILDGKNHIPEVQPSLVRRLSLIEKLNESIGSKLIILSAPAGYGRTTVVADWLKHVQRPAAWLALESTDDAPTIFWNHLIRSIQHAIPDLALILNDLLIAAGSDSLELPVPTLLDTIAASSLEFTIVLNDYHCINDPRIHDSMLLLINNLPSSVKLFIDTRERPPWPLSRMRMQGQVFELGIDDLRFTLDEAQAYLNEVMELDLSQPDVEMLETCTEGWIAGLRLAALSLRKLDSASRRQFISFFSGRNRLLVDYFIDEVLSGQPEHIKDFMIQASILERFCAPLCDAIRIDDTDIQTQSFLEELERCNLFVMALDEERHWFRFHGLFLDFLRYRVDLIDAANIPTRHSRASNWYEQNGLFDEAIGHAMLAKDWIRAAILIEHHAMEFFTRGEARTVNEWLQTLPDTIIRARPWLCVIHALVLFYFHQLQEVETRIQDTSLFLKTIGVGDVENEHAVVSSFRPTSTLSADLSETEVPEILGYLDAIRAHVAVIKEEIPRAIQLARGMRRQPSQENFVHGLRAMALGYAFGRSGNIERANRAFFKAREIGLVTGNAYLALGAPCSMGNLMVLAGRLHQAADYYNDAIMQATRSDVRLPILGYAYACMGDLLREWNDLEEAASNLIESVESYSQSHAGTLVSYGTLARVRQAQGDVSGAYDAIKRANQLVSNPAVDPVALRWLDDSRVRLWLATGDIAAAVNWAKESGLKIDDELSYKRNLEHITLARILISQGRAYNDHDATSQALTLLGRLLKAARRANWIGKVIEILVLRAHAHMIRGEEREALSSLYQSLLLAEPEGYARIYLDEGEVLAILFKALVEAHINYANRLPPRIFAYANSIAGAPIFDEAGQTTFVPYPQTVYSVEPLTDREIEILNYLCSGLSNREIAEKLIISMNTVSFHTKNIYSKLKVNSRIKAMLRAKDLGIL